MHWQILLWPFRTTALVLITTYTAVAGGDPVTMTTPVLQPGCGQLTFGVDCCHVDHYLAIKATKV